VKQIRAALVSLVGWTILGLLTGALTVLVIPLSPEVHAYIGRFAVAFLVSWWIWAAITPVVRAASRYELVDFVSREPSLEETFLAQYGPQGEAPIEAPKDAIS